MPTAIVAHRASNVLRYRREIRNQSVNRFGLKGRIARDGLVQIGHVSVVVLAMMNLHRLGINVGFEGFFGIGKSGEFVCHNIERFTVSCGLLSREQSNSLIDLDRLTKGG